MTKIITPNDPAPELPTIGQEPEYGQLIIPNIEIVGPRLLVAPKPRKERTTGTGIIIPEQAQEHSQEGVVIIVGDGIMLENGERIPSRVQPGQAIIYARYAGAELEMEGHKFMIIQESDIRCILTYKGLIFQAEE
jgi:chaperonin GroES